jgi:chromosome segregation ATPase
MGILCDGQMMLGDVIDRVFDLAAGTAQPVGRTADRKIGKPAGTGNDDDDNDDEQEQGSAPAGATEIVSPINSTTMTDKKYEKITQLLGVEELAVTEEGTFLNVALLDSLEEKLEKMESGAAKPGTAQEEEKPAVKVEEPAGQSSEEDLQEAQAEIDRITETLHNAEQMVAEKDSQIAALEQEKADLNDAVTAKDSQIEQLQADVDSARAALTEASAKVAEHEATIETLSTQVNDLKAEVKELSKEEKPMVDGSAGAAPAGNGTGDAPKNMGAVKSEITSDMTVEEIRERLRQKDEKQKTWRH